MNIRIFLFLDVCRTLKVSQTICKPGSVI